MDFIKGYSDINICDIGASPCDATPFIDSLLENTNSKITGFSSFLFAGPNLFYGEPEFNQSIKY